ncbi:MAG: FAD-dependent oxidoreductase [Henriciella sp.]|nr:FAD-dependent oxidoreductase [Henriciella sp.]
MKIAIIGGGASGLVSAYLLQAVHEVHVFEREQILGGHVRTLNRNLKTDRLLNGTAIEMGVLGFHEASYPKFHKLMQHLGVELGSGQPTSSLYRKNEYFPSKPANLASAATLLNVVRSPSYGKRISQLRSAYATTFRPLLNHDLSDDKPISEILAGPQHVQDFVQSLAALAFSTPYDDAGSLPASIVVPYLRAIRGERAPDWSFVRGGVYRYMETLQAEGQFQVHLGVPDIKIRRSDNDVNLTAQGQSQTFDAVVVATSPGQVASIILDQDETEARWFADWSDRTFSTTAHTDMKLYGRFAGTAKMPMDLFVDHNGKARGYNTYMNTFYELDQKTPYAFAHGLDDLIDPETIIARTDHTVPVYSVAAMKQRDEVRRHNGYRRIYYAGAYLGNGLHEGAVCSALAVSELLGGLRL